MFGALCCLGWQGIKCAAELMFCHSMVSCVGAWKQPLTHLDMRLRVSTCALSAHCCRRLLDDNRELFVPELQEVVRPHPHFMLFATQNPPGLYAGRKALSRAFR